VYYLQYIIQQLLTRFSGPHKAYKKNALKFHPDRNQGDEAAKERAKQQFQAISQAYEELTGAFARRNAARVESTARPTHRWPAGSTSKAAGFGPNVSFSGTGAQTGAGGDWVNRGRGGYGAAKNSWGEPPCSPERSGSSQGHRGAREPSRPEQRGQGAGGRQSAPSVGRRAGFEAEIESSEAHPPTHQTPPPRGTHTGWEGWCLLVAGRPRCRSPVESEACGGWPFPSSPPQDEDWWGSDDEYDKTPLGQAANMKIPPATGTGGKGGAASRRPGAKPKERSPDLEGCSSSEGDVDWLLPTPTPTAL